MDEFYEILEKRILYNHYLVVFSAILTFIDKKNKQMHYQAMQVCNKFSPLDCDRRLSSVKRRRKASKANQEIVKIDKDKIIQEEISEVGKVCVIFICQKQLYSKKGSHHLILYFIISSV